MLDEVKESIINAYEIKTGLDRKKLSKLMDVKPGWTLTRLLSMALQMGSCREIQQRIWKSQKVGMTYSRAAVTNSLMDKLAKMQDSKAGTKDHSRLPVERLDLIKNWRNFIMTIQELREARNKAWQGAKAFVESKRDKDGLLSKEDAGAYAKMEQKIKDYSAEI